MSEQTEPITITITIYPPKNGRRKILITGAAQGDMPSVLEGTFASIHALIDQMWLTLLDRLKKKKSKPKEAEEASGATQAALPVIEGDAAATEEPMTTSEE